MAWARAVGVFGPLMVFVGTGPRVLVMPTALWLELSIGNIETALAISLIMLFMAGTALAVVHFLVPEGGVV
jgi:molybdate transport system permease protein